MYDKKTLMRYGRINWIALIFGIFILASIFFAFGSDLQELVFRTQNKSSFNETRATVVNFIETSSTDDDGDTTYSYYPIAEYEVGGITYVQEFYRAQANSFGAQIELLYDPANPQYAVLSKADINIVLLIIIIIFFIIGIASLVAFISSIRRRNALLDFERTEDMLALNKSKARLYQSKQSAFPFLPIIFGAIFVFVGLAVPFMVSNSVNNAKRTAETFTPVTATVVDSNDYVMRKGYDYNGYVLSVQAAEYEVNGKTYARVLSRGTSYSIGNSLSLCYDPNNPGYTVFADAGGNVTLVTLVSLLFGIPFALMGLVPVVFGIKQWRKNKNQIN